MATLRNWLIGCYIVEYEQKGSDRAKYGDRLLKRLEESVNTRGLNETLFKNSRRFYLLYPQIGMLFGKSATPSDEFRTSPNDILCKLSFSKTTLTDYQCVSTGCYTHVAKTKITIDNQHVTNITAKVQIYLQTTKRKHRKNHKMMQNLTCPKAFYAFFTIILVLQPISRFYGRASLGYCQ